MVANSYYKKALKERSKRRETEKQAVKREKEEGMRGASPTGKKKNLHNKGIGYPQSVT